MKKFSIMLVLLFAVSLFAQGEIDWERRVVRATGIGAPNPNAPNMAAKRAGAINAAKMVALRDLLATIKGMYVSSSQTVENYMTTSDVVKSQVEGIAKAFKVVGKPKYFDDGSVEVTVEMSIDGDLSALLTDGMEYGVTEPVEMGTSYENNTQNTASGVYTGLVVDCRDISLRPALSPKILDENGQEVYGSAYVSKDFAVQQGMMGYLKDISKAKGNVRVGENPFIVKAINVDGANKTDIVISNEDALKIKELSQNLSFLRECRVISVIK